MVVHIGEPQHSINEFEKLFIKDMDNGLTAYQIAVKYRISRTLAIDTVSRIRAKQLKIREPAQSANRTSSKKI